ncbi:DUF3565 domain-containing protein [Fodinibius sp. Rm-B-1B1-1]
MKQPIIGYHKDEDGDWVAELQCGYNRMYDIIHRGCYVPG